LQNDQVTIAGHEVELRDLKNATHYVMDCIAAQVEGEEPKSILGRLIETLDRLLTLLKVTSLAVATYVRVRVSHTTPTLTWSRSRKVLMRRKTSRLWSLKLEMSPWR
jgi:hypothetical protein